MARLLVIHDPRITRPGWRQPLTDAGHEVFEALDGETGLRIYRRKVIELVLADLVVREMNGLEFIRELCADFPDALVIATGGRFGTTEIFEAALACGAVRTLVKPYADAQLVQVVEEVLRDPLRSVGVDVGT